MVADDFAAGTRTVQARIEAAARRAGRDLSAHPVEVLAATKYLAPAQMRALVGAGVRLFGENRLAALEECRRELADLADIRWDYIGRLQSRQAVPVAQLVDRIHSLASDSAAARMAAAADGGLPLPQLLVQVNVARDPAKDGILPDELFPFLERLPGELQVAGLMTMPAAASTPDQSRSAFAELRALLERGRGMFEGRHPLDQLSMGTSQDFEVAVEEGATVVRLGQVLYA